MSWRDPDHPKAGGAELFTYEVARRLVDGGDSVEWFTSTFPGAQPTTEKDGVRIVRAGQQWSVHYAAIRRYRNSLKGRFDAVVDEVNTIPFFTPLWADVPRTLLIFQLAREVWWHESPFPLSALGYAIEPLYLRLYKSTPALTISESTKADLLRLGYTAPIGIVPIGLEAMTTTDSNKAEPKTFLYVGRLAKSKRVSDIIQAFAGYRSPGRPGRLWLIGDGSPAYVNALHRQVDRLHVDNVEFLGRVPAAEKHTRMAQAAVLLMASAREGWGLAVAEANAYGTPAVVYDVPGLRDAVRNEETGLVVAPSPDKLTEGMVRLSTQPDLYARLAREARRWSSTFSFDAAARDFRTAIERTIADFHKS
jgi:glycosyltransferase involved in cell wall biosynthesis